jgi:hypothetical protein
MARPHNRFSLGVKIQMSKKLFLAAASVAAMTMAGAASAGEISGLFNADAVDAADKVAFNATTPYNLAKERNVTDLLPAEGSVEVAVDLTTNIVVPTGAQRDHLVTLEIGGADVDYTQVVLTTDHATPANVTSSYVGLNTDGKPQYLLTIGEGTVGNLYFAFDLRQEEQASVTVTTSTKAVIGADKIAVDDSTATIAQYKAVLASLTVSGTSDAEAQLDEYTHFAANVTAAVLASGFDAVETGTYYGDFDGNTIDASDILAGGLVTITGPLVSNDVYVSLVDGNTTAGSPDFTQGLNKVVWDLSTAEAEDFINGEFDAKLDRYNGSVAAYKSGTYKLTWAPEANTNFTVPAAQSVDLGTVSLAGTNFVAPWVAGATTAKSFIRLSNSNSADSGEITVRLDNAVTANGNVSTPFESTLDVWTLDEVVPAGGDLQIRSQDLVDKFGAFTRADVRITIKSARDGFTAKMRNNRGETTFEQSLVQD